MDKVYTKAQIYKTTCTHPDYQNLGYIGLDTKCDPLYLGSSVVLKWWIQRLGRSHFRKEILEEVSGDMAILCNREQDYIEMYEAVSSPDYFNLNGRSRRTVITDNILTMDYVVIPTSHQSQMLIAEIIEQLSCVVFMTHSKSQTSSRVLSLLAYGHLKYEQGSFEYTQQKHYGSCTDTAFEGILSGLCELGYIDLVEGTIIPTDLYLQELECEGINHTNFECTLTDKE
tara:strand:+ start:2499 stop:3182 length:684 start_codon:yes stop_codon:yes gene_type:complete